MLTNETQATIARLEEIQERVNAATPGPWAYDGQHNEITKPTESSYWLLVSECRSAPDQEHPTDEFGHSYDANFDFIARARSDVPALISAVHELQAENERLRKIIGKELEDSK